MELYLLQGRPSPAASSQPLEESLTTLLDSTFSAGELGANRNEMQIGLAFYVSNPIWAGGGPGLIGLLAYDRCVSNIGAPPKGWREVGRVSRSATLDNMLASISNGIANSSGFHYMLADCLWH